MFTNVVAGRVRVRCTTPACPSPADTSVDLYYAARGVVARPALICAGCGSALAVVEEGDARA